MDAFSSLNVGITGVLAQSAAINTISGNVANSQTVGYKQATTNFAELVSDNSANNYSVNGGGSADDGFAPAGVGTSTTEENDIQGSINATTSPTDLAISGSGFFIVSPTAKATVSNLEYTREGSFTPDVNGNYANAAGDYLQAWALDAYGNPPADLTGANINSAAAIAALQPVNIQALALTPEPTSIVTLQANLDSSQSVYPLGSDTVTMDQNDGTNSGISADTVIIPTATDDIVQGDQMTITTANNPTGFTYTYGGIAFSRSIANTSIDGSSGLGLQQPVDLTPQSGGGTTAAFAFNSATPTTMTINENPATVGVTQVGQVVNLSGTGAAGGINVNNISSLDGDYYVTAIGANNFTVTIPADITPPSPIALTGSTYTVGATSTSITVSGINVPSGLTTGDTITIAGAPALAGLTGANIDGSWPVTSVTPGAGGSFTFTIGTTSNGVGGSTSGNGSTVFDDTGDLADTNTATVTSRLFSGDILDATDVASPLINTPADFVPAALSFTITTASTGTSTFTYTPVTPNAAAGQFNSLDNLATAISDVSGLSAKVSNNQLYISSVNGDDAITFANGSATGSNTSPPLGGIDWVSELGLANVAVGTNRFSTMQGLANLVNGSANLTATVNDPAGPSTVKINVDDEEDTITFADVATNQGSLLGELGLAPSLNGGAFVPQTAGSFGYDPTVGTNNMAGGGVTPQFVIPVTVIDSANETHIINVGFLNTGINTWAAEIYASPASDVTAANGQLAIGTVTFNSDGTLASVSPALQNVTATWTDTGGGTSDITFNLGTAGALFGTPNAPVIGRANGLEQLDSPSNITSIQQNGIQTDTTTTVSVTSSGQIEVTYASGATRALYQIPLANFLNPDQLSLVAGNAFLPTEAAGTETIVTPGVGGDATIVPSALEQSNVQLSTQLTNMIIAQNSYQANDQTITVSNQMLQNAVQMDVAVPD